MASGKEYTAVIDQRVLRVVAPNVWIAAERAAILFRNTALEGLRFFRGDAEMELWRVGMLVPVFRGNVEKWLACFRSQGRNTRRWDRVIETRRIRGS